ncbi:MAG: 8-amino-7-oxononanoate synthase [Candidatus Gastranaerophilales bacterium]
MYDKFSDELKKLEEQSHLREVKKITFKDEKYIEYNGAKLLNLSSNNYLGFGDNSSITKEFLSEVNTDYGFGSTSARLLTGELPIYDELEQIITKAFGTEKSLIFNSGYHANVGIMSSICGLGDVVFSDKLNHASIIDGMKLARGKFFRYPHLNYESLEHQLIEHRGNYDKAFIVSESVFSMDGDLADLKKLVELKQKYNCILIIDEAHAFGVFGEKGLGLCEKTSLISEIDLIVGTFGKAIGSVGAFATGKKVLIKYFINKARSFIFSTALAPINIAFSKWIIEKKLPETKLERQNMLALAQEFGSDSHIIPIIVGSNFDTIELCQKLLENGYFTLPIRPPTVKEGTSRIRISLTTQIKREDLVKLCNIIGLAN